MEEQNIEQQLSALKVSLTAAGISPTLLDSLGKKIKLDDENEVEVNSEYLAKQIQNTILSKGVNEGKYKEFEPYKKELEEMNRKRFNDEIKEIGEALLPDNPDLAKEIAAKYKQEGKFTPAQLRKFASELKEIRVKDYEERLKNVSLEGKQFQEVLDNERRQRTTIEQEKRELETLLERLKGEEIPSIEERYKGEIEKVKWQTHLFREFYKLPSVYDDEIAIGRKEAELAKENHISKWLINSFSENYEAKPDGYGGLQFYEKGKQDPVWVTNHLGQRVPATLSDIVRIIAKDPIKGGKYYKASNGGSGGTLPPDDSAKAALERDKKRNSYFGR